MKNSKLGMFISVKQFKDCVQVTSFRKQMIGNMVTLKKKIKQQQTILLSFRAAVYLTNNCHLKKENKSMFDVLSCSP